MKRTFLGYGIAVALAASAAYGANQITRFVMGSGGIGGSGTVHKITSTAGQPVAGTVSAATHSVRSGFWVPQSAPSGVGGGPLPTSFRLSGTYPNPFHEQVEIGYDVPAPGGVVSLRVFDVSGRLVRSLVRGFNAPGRKRVLWDGRDDAGNRLPLGIYLLSFEAPGTSVSRKAVRIK